MANIIIVEGPDGSGKSTLIDHVLKPDTFFHNGLFGTPEDAYNVYRKQAQLALSIVNDSFVLDRSHIAQAIYGPVMRDEQFEDHEEIHWEVDKLFYDAKAVIILCHGPHSMDNWEASSKEQKGEYVKKQEQMQAIYDEYIHIDKYSRLPHIIYEYTDSLWENPIDILDAVGLIRKMHYGD